LTHYKIDLKGRADDTRQGMCVPLQGVLLMLKELVMIKNSSSSSVLADFFFIVQLGSMLLRCETSL
jgi:hypothetical protein